MKRTGGGTGKGNKGEPLAKTAAITALALVVAVALRAFPSAFGGFADPDHYYHLRQIEFVASNGALPAFDALSDGGRQYTYYPLLHLAGGTLATLLGISGAEAYALLSLMAGALCVLSVFVVARRALALAGLEPDYAAFGALFAACTPAFFLRQGIYGRPDAFAAGLLALCLIAVAERRIFLAAVLGAATALLHPYSFAVICALALAGLCADGAAAMAFRTRPRFAGKKAVVALAAFAAAGAVAAAYYLGLPLSELGIRAATFRTSSEMQSPDAVGVIQLFGATLVFAGVCALELFLDKKRTAGVAWLFGIALCSAPLLLLAQRNYVFAAVPLAVLACVGIAFAVRRSGEYAKWLWPMIGVAVLAASYSALNVQGRQYSSEQVAGFSYMQPLPSGAVAALWDRGHAITYLSQKPVVVDGYFEFAPQLDERVRDVAWIYLSNDTEKISALSAKWGAEYVFFDKKTAIVYGGANASPFSSALSAKPEKGFDKLFDSADAQVYRLG